MILDFSFSNFGPVNKEVALSFEATADDTLEDYYITRQEDGTRILKMGIIYGPNASGKTTILKALEMLRDLVVSPLEQKEDPIRYKKFLLDEKCREKPSTFKIRFYLNGIKYMYQLSFNYERIISEELTYYPKNRPAKVYSRKTKDDVSKIEFGSTINFNKKDRIILEGNTIRNNTVLGSFSKSNISIEPIEDVYNWFKANITPIISPKHSLFEFTINKIDKKSIDKSKVIELLQNADLNIFDLEIIKEEEKIDEEVRKIFELLPIPDDAKEKFSEKDTIERKDVIFKHRFKSSDGDVHEMQLEKEWESNGTIRYYGLTGAVLSSIEDNKILFIDEFDSSLHPDLMKNLILSYLSSSSNSQLLFTTHNISFMMERDIIRNDALWFTEKNDQGAVDLFSLAEFNSDKFRRESSIYNAYSLGKIGAKPNVTGIF